MNGKKVNITIVGLQKEYAKEEVISQLITQNEFLRQLNKVNDLNEDFSIHDIKCTRVNDKVFQVFASVSDRLREGLKNYMDKVTIGLVVCKIYDRAFIKRCNNCQGLGHFYKECKSPDFPICGKCSENHRTDSCTSLSRKCINCTKHGSSSIDHAAFDHKCPQIIAYSDTNQTSITLNM